MNRSGVVPPPPWSPPSDLIYTDTSDYEFVHVKFNGDRLVGAKRSDLMVGLRNMPETLSIIEEGTGWGDIYTLFRIRDDLEAVRQLDDWITRLNGQRIFHRVQTIWVRQGQEMVRVCK